MRYYSEETVKEIIEDTVNATLHICKPKTDYHYIEIKEPHGRLIDADRLADEFDVYLATTYPFMQNSVAEGMVNDVRLATQIAPTILEAST